MAMLIIRMIEPENFLVRVQIITHDAEMTILRDVRITIIEKLFVLSLERVEPGQIPGR